LTFAPNRRTALSAAVSMVAALAALAAPMAHAQAFPAKPITIVVAYPAGGDTDVLARVLADKLSTRLGQPVVVENRSGAAGTIGAGYVAKARADGYTLLLAPNTIAITPHVLKGVTGASRSPATELTSIVQLGSQSLFVVAASSIGASNVKELVAKIKAGKVTSYASPGSGSPMHILGELFDRAAGVKLTQIPYRGSAPAVADLVGGQLPMMYSTLGPVSPHIKSGKLVALGVADARRSAFLPDVPTLAEQGFKGAEVGAWQALMGPKGMPAEVVQSLNRHVNEILKAPDVIARMDGLALTPVGGDPGALAKLVAGDYARYSRLVSEFGIKAE
jgi:tripartite-type tricarboxylate transporter receptor subunit TctC